MKKMIHSNLSVGENSHLFFGGADTVEMAKKYGTPLMLVDENRIRRNGELYVKAMKKYFGGDSCPLLASKALCFTQIYKIAASIGMKTDIVSPGELYIAKKAGFPMENAYFHGNNKTDEDIVFAIECGIGYFVVDNQYELFEINKVAKEKGITQKILLRLSPGIDPHTHAKISTGRVDSKFGTAIETGQADEIVRAALSLEGVELCGFHCHIGSQIFECEPFISAADIMIGYVAHVKEVLGFEAKILNLGGGFGVRYIDEDPYIDIEENIKRIAGHVRTKCAELSVNMPTVLMEPGRSIVADAGLTLYTVGSVKNITGYKSYVSIDGGMTDNPRYSLYGSRYTFEIANKAGEDKPLKCTVAGRCCESGDLIGEDVPLQNAEKGDILATLVTGAYNYSMASNYNKIPRPPIVIIKEGKDILAVRRETYADLVRLDS